MRVQKIFGLITQLIEWEKIIDGNIIWLIESSKAAVVFSMLMNLMGVIFKRREAKRKIIGGVEWKWCRGSTVAVGDVENLIILF